VLFALRYAFGALTSIFAVASALRSPQIANSIPGGPLVLYGELLANLLILVGILVGLGVLFNVGNLALRLPGFSSPASRTRRIAWVGYGAVMAVLLVVLNVALPAAARSGAHNPAQDLMHVTVTAADDGGESFVAVGGDLTADLVSWPSSEWSGISFKTSNPGILSLDQTPPAGSPPVAVFGAHQVGVARVDAASADGRYTFQVRVNVFASG
jgi:hypothetical protein